MFESDAVLLGVGWVERISSACLIDCTVSSRQLYYHIKPLLRTLPCGSSTLQQHFQEASTSSRHTSSSSKQFCSCSNSNTGPAATTAARWFRGKDSLQGALQLELEGLKQAHDSGLYGSIRIHAGRPFNTIPGIQALTHWQDSFPLKILLVVHHC